MTVSDNTALYLAVDFDNSNQELS